MLSITSMTFSDEIVDCSVWNLFDMCLIKLSGPHFPILLPILKKKNQSSFFFIMWFVYSLLFSWLNF